MSELRMTRGDDRTFDIDITNPEDGSPIELSAFEGIWFTAKRRISDADDAAAFQKALNDGVQLDGAIVGRAAVTVDAADTDDQPDRLTRLVWDVQVRDDLGDIVTVASGTLVVSPDVTRANGTAS